MYIYTKIYNIEVVLKSVDHIPNGAVLEHWAHSVCACDQYGFSEASHVHLYVHDYSTAANAERWAVGALIDFGIS